MRYWLFLIAFALHAVDYDCIVVGSSPIPVFEALYQHALGKKVLILEGDTQVGGAWRSIDVCGVAHADLGCHLICSDCALAQFLADYAGCQVVSLDKPTTSFPMSKGGNGFYFSKGCYELVQNLMALVRAQSIDFFLGEKVLTATVDEKNDCLIVESERKSYTTNKMFITPYTYLQNGESPPPAKTKFYHLYLLIQDPSLPRFSYSHGIPGVTRMMNVTHFVDLKGTGRQLVAFQVHSQEWLAKGTEIFEALKKKGLVDTSAYVLDSQSYIFEQWPSNRFKPKKDQERFMDTLQTHQLSKMTTYMAKWKEKLPLYKEIIRSVN